MKSVGSSSSSNGNRSGHRRPEGINRAKSATMIRKSSGAKPRVAGRRGPGENSTMIVVSQRKRCALELTPDDNIIINKSDTRMIKSRALSDSGMIKSSIKQRSSRGLSALDVNHFIDDEDPRTLSPRELALHGKYVLREVIASGAYGTVRNVKDFNSLSNVVIKVIPKEILLSPEENLSVIRECMIHETLCHENIVNFVEHFEDDEAHYLVLSRVENKTLGDHLKLLPLKITSEGKVRYIFIQLVSALKYMHQRGVVHHDVKPLNILVDSEFQLKLCDFGASRAFNYQGDTSANTVLKFSGLYGTSGYLAPELLTQSSCYGPGIDIWSAGIVLFEMVFGYTPFYPPCACVSEDVEFPSRTSLSQDLVPSSEVISLIQSMLCRDPNSRISAAQILIHPWVINRLD